MALDFDPTKKVKGTTSSVKIFEEPQKSVLMKVMRNAKEWVTIIINKSEIRREFKLILRETSLQPIVIFANKGGKAGGHHISIEAEETLVIKWV